MRVTDIMTASVITVLESTPIADAAQTLLQHRISAAPVLSDAGALVGVVSEGDFMRRAQGDNQQRSWWLRLIADPGINASDYVKAHGSQVKDVMTTELVTISEDMAVSNVARLLEAEHIKRAPVVRDGKLVGIVSRADILRGLAARSERDEHPGSPTDNALRAQILERIDEADWAPTYGLSVFVNEGVVEIWGVVEASEQRDALRVLAQTAPGVKQVDLHLGSIPARAWAQ